MANGAVGAGKTFTDVFAAGGLFEGVVVDGRINGGVLMDEALWAGALVAQALTAELPSLKPAECKLAKGRIAERWMTARWVAKG
jgi:hypothetical protein